LIFSELENIAGKKRTNRTVGSSGFISLNRLKTDFYFQDVSNVLMKETNHLNTLGGSFLIRL